MHRQIFKRHIQRHMGFEPDKIARDAGFVGILDQSLAALGLFDFACARQKRVEIAIFLNQLRGRLDPDTRHAGHIVDAVARQRLHVDDALRPDAEFLDYFLAANALVFHRVVERHAIAHELHQILIGRDDGGGSPRLGGKPCIGGDQIIRLVIFLLDRGDVEGANRIADEFKLRAQIFGRLGPVGFVFGIKPIPEGLGGMVENDRQMGRPLARYRITQKLPQHVAEPGHGADRQAIGFARQRRKRVKSTENIARSIYKKHVIAAFDRFIQHYSVLMLKFGLYHRTARAAVQKAVGGPNNIPLLAPMFEVS